MISASKLIGLRGPRKTGRGARVFRGKASTLAGGGEHRGNGGVFHWDEREGQKDDHQVRAKTGDQGIPIFVFMELIRGKDAYCPSDCVPWGSTSSEAIHLERIWFFEEFVLLEISPAPTTPAGGQPWVQYTTIQYRDRWAIEDFCDRTGLVGADLVAMSILLDRHS